MQQRKPSSWEALPFMRSIMAGSAPLPPGGRDERLDMFRGLALVMIFVNHVPGTIFEYFTNRNFGFSDAAEAFVFMSGVAAGLAYSGAFIKKVPLWLAVARPWARARQLYFVHLTLTFIFLATFAGAAHFFGLYKLLEMNNLRAFSREPLSTLVGVPLLTHQFGYLNILPLYLTLLLATPLLIVAALRRPYWLVAASIALWFVAGLFRFNFPNFPNSGGWFFNPLSWQLLFVLGLVAGIGMKQGRRMFPIKAWAFIAALAFLVITVLWMKWPPMGALGNGALRGLWQLGAPFHIHSFDKTFLSLPRLLHALCLFYVLASIPAMQGISASWLATPLRIMGRQGLPVFATGTALSLLFQAMKVGIPGNALTDGIMLCFGLLVQVGLALALTRTAAMRADFARAKPAA